VNPLRDSDEVVGRYTRDLHWDRRYKRIERWPEPYKPEEPEPDPWWAILGWSLGVAVPVVYVAFVVWVSL
jgi:hypothetical protein